MKDTERTNHDRLPFDVDNCAGYSLQEIDELNAEFVARWNGWEVPDTQLFLWKNGELMSTDEAIKAFQNEVAGR